MILKEKGSVVASQFNQKIEDDQKPLFLFNLNCCGVTGINKYSPSIEVTSNIDAPYLE